MRIVIGATALLLLAVPGWAQDAAQHAQHPHPSSSSAQTDKATAHGKAGMQVDMMKHCKTMQQTGEARPMDKSANREADCKGMHHEMHKSDSAKHKQ